MRKPTQKGRSSPASPTPLRSDPADGARADGERIAKVLARAGVASRRDAERMIAEGRVRLNGKVVASPAINVTPSDRVLVDGAPLAPPEPPRVWLYHKPPGLVTTERDEKDRPTVFDALPEDMPRVMSVGRLDLNSEGLLLLTNDGEIKRRLELPATGWLRRYRVRINGSVSEAKLDELRAGITVDGVNYAPMGVTFDRQQGANAWLTVTLREGKNREIRRTMEAVGVTVNRLIRIGYGPFKLGELKPGEVEELKSRVLRDQLGLDQRPAVERRRKGEAPVRTASDATAKPRAQGAKPARDADGKPVPRSRGMLSHGGAAAGKPARALGYKSHKQDAQKPGEAAPGRTKDNLTERTRAPKPAPTPEADTARKPRRPARARPASTRNAVGPATPNPRPGAPGGKKPRG